MDLYTTLDLKSNPVKSFQWAVMLCRHAQRQ